MMRVCVPSILPGTNNICGLEERGSFGVTWEAWDAADLADLRVETLTPLEMPDLVAGIEGQHVGQGKYKE